MVSRRFRSSSILLGNDSLHGAAIHQGFHQAGKACFRLITQSFQALRATCGTRLKLKAEKEELKTLQKGSDLDRFDSSQTITAPFSGVKVQ